MSGIVYLDNAATTPVDPRVIEAMTSCLGPAGEFANPSSAHALGVRAWRIVERAREQIALRVNAAPERIVFTSGGTESNNLALKGVLHARRGALLTTRIEHRSVLASAEALAGEGFAVAYVGCDGDGLVAPERVEAALTNATALVSVMHVNNEIGAVEDIAAIARICRARGALLHVDAAQSAGKVPIDIEGWGIDLCSLTAHKINGPKGIGALYVRAGVGLAPLLHGGDPALAPRGGTLATHQIAGMGQAYELADPGVEGPRLAALRERLWAGLAGLEGVARNGDPHRCAPHILSVTFRGVDGESLLLGVADVAVSRGSACASTVPETSHVLSGIGLSDALAQSTVRLSVGRFTSEAEIDYAVGRFAEELERLRGLARSAPAWCSR